MDNRRMIDLLRQAGLSFEPGMSDSELDRAENVFHFRFPKEIREFLSCGVPIGSSFFNFRDISDENLTRFREFQDFVERSFYFDLENNREDLLVMLSKKLGFKEDSVLFDDAVIRYLNRSVRLIPFYGHRCFFDGMDGMPMISFWQPVDMIYYGGTFSNYLACEFLKKARVLECIEDRMKDTGIWFDLLQ